MIICFVKVLYKGVPRMLLTAGPARKLWLHLESLLFREPWELRAE